MQKLAPLTTAYISGKITGMEEKAIELFAEAEKKLKEIGLETINPMTLNHDHDKSWSSYMRVCLKSLCDCDVIYMLTNWDDSEGAIIEHNLAISLGIKVIYEPLRTFSEATQELWNPRNSK